MKFYRTIGPAVMVVVVALGGGALGVFSSARAADAPAAKTLDATPSAANPTRLAQAPPVGEHPAPPDPVPQAIPPTPMVSPAGPGVFSAKKVNATNFHLVVAGHTFTSRKDIEMYLAYRAAQVTKEQGDGWFSFVEHRAKGDKVPVSKPDPLGDRFSFRMEFFRPTWRYKIAGSNTWKSWSPFSGAPFWADGVDPKTVTDFEVTADIVLHKGPLESDNPLAFDGSALSDFLVNQVAPPK